MIVFGNSEFSTGMKLIGIKDSFTVRKKEDVLEKLKDIPNDEFMLVNVSVMEMVPELKEYPNAVSIPDNAEEFSKTDDLKDIISSAIGFEINL